ncbi:hypothetical protein AHAS_Ahas14G0162700 [Arachis hypogaea]
MQRKRNKVQGLFLENGRWSTDLQELENCAIGFYRDLFCNVEQVDLDVIGDQELPSLSREAIESLTRDVSKEEEVVGTEVWELVKKAFAGFDLDSALFDTLVVLIPKVDNPSRMKEFRPISLCNVIYKIITKVVLQRLRPFLQDIIGPLQGGFIPGRGAPNNIIVAQEVLHFMKKTKSKKGVLAFKIDLEKAYDRSSSLSLMWNGNRLDDFQPNRGLRQGDPMSPYLFVICMERLSCLIARQMEVGRWKSVTVSRGGPVISHLLFADDLILFCKAKKSQVLHVLDTMATFCRASGMKVNFDKSRAIYSMNISRQRKDLFTGIFSIRFANSLGKYLGVPLKHGRVTKADFNDVVDKLTNWLASWKGARVEFLDIWEATLTIKNIYRDGVWHLERIYSFIPRDLREDILSLVHISASDRDLGWSWEHTLYSTKQGYLWLIQNKLNWDRNINWLWLWKARVPEKLRLLVWLCLHDAVPTQYLRFSDVCFFGSYEVHDWFKHGFLNEGCSKFAAIIWSIWQDRNIGNFQGVFGSPGSIAYKARMWMVDFEYTTQNRMCCVQGLKPLSWSPPEPENSFGSSVIKMELWSIWKGLAWAWEAGLKLVVCETDCAVAFELVTDWQVPL